MAKIGVINLCKEIENVRGKFDNLDVKIPSNNSGNKGLGINSNKILRHNDFDKMMEMEANNINNKSSFYLCDVSVNKSLDINLTDSFDNVINNYNYQNTSVENSDNEELDWFGLMLVAVFCILIVITIIGNTLIILSVITTKRLRTVTNCFGEYWTECCTPSAFLNCDLI